MNNSIRLQVNSEPDIVAARQRGKRLAKNLGMNGADLTLVATAISEIARNMLDYAGGGQLVMKCVLEGDAQRGVQITARDNGPGIENVDRAMCDGYSTSEGLGLGLPGARRVMDEFDIDSQPGVGTTVQMRKWT